MNNTDYMTVVAGVAENLAFLMPTGEVEGDSPVWFIHIQVQWVGPDGTRGQIVVALDSGAAEATASNLLGLSLGEPPCSQDIQEACCELANVISGNILPIKYGDNHEFHLYPPQQVHVSPLEGKIVVRLALVEGVIGVAIQTDMDNTRILKAVRLPQDIRT